MKKLILLSIIFLLFSCRKEKTVYTLILYIKNNSNIALNIEVFPKAIYRENSYLYQTGVGSGYLSSEFPLDVSMNRELFYSADITLEPDVLINQIFDSIIVASNDNSSVHIKFSPDSVTGYDQNLFKDSSFWTYEIRNQDHATMFKLNPHELHEYTFPISLP